MMVICVKQHLSNIWSSIYELSWKDWVEKERCLYKKRVVLDLFTGSHSRRQERLFKWAPIKKDVVS